jgi:hypothetical protein
MKNLKTLKKIDRFAISPGVLIGRSVGSKEKQSLPLYGTW